MFCCTLRSSHTSVRRTPLCILISLSEQKRAVTAERKERKNAIHRPAKNHEATSTKSFEMKMRMNGTNKQMIERSERIGGRATERNREKKWNEPNKTFECSRIYYNYCCYCYTTIIQKLTPALARAYVERIHFAIVNGILHVIHCLLLAD